MLRSSKRLDKSDFDIPKTCSKCEELDFISIWILPSSRCYDVRIGRIISENTHPISLYPHNPKLLIFIIWTYTKAIWNIFWKKISTVPLLNSSYLFSSYMPEIHHKLELCFMLTRKKKINEVTSLPFNSLILEIKGQVKSIYNLLG